MSLMKTPRSVDLEITSRCNLRCRYCYFFNNAAVQYQDLPTSEWLQFFDELGSLGVMTACIAGGEPFIREDLRELITGVVQNRMRYSLLSNGGLIDDSIAAFIAETGRCEFIQISVDGSCAEVHDSCRGQGAFDAAMRGIQILQRHNVPVTVRVTVHRGNVRDLDNIARLLLDELKLEGFGTNSAGYLGSCRMHADDVMLNREERILAMTTLERLAEKYDGRITASAGPLADARMWREMEEAASQKASPFEDRGRLTGCGCPAFNIAVRADGVMIPCSMLAHMELGKINRDRLQDVWLHNADLNAMRERNRIPLSDFEFCGGCEYMQYCTGNCPGLSYSLTGAVNHPSPEACLRHFMQPQTSAAPPFRPAPKARGERVDSHTLFL
jgi:Fe-coproporphyrin III synthase